MSFINRFFAQELHNGRLPENGAELCVIGGGYAFVRGCEFAFYGLVGSWTLWLLGGSYSAWLSMASGLLGGIIVGVPLLVGGMLLGAMSNSRPGFDVPNIGSFAMDFLGALLVGAIGGFLVGVSALPVVAGMAMTTAIELACMSSCPNGFNV